MKNKILFETKIVGFEKLLLNPNNPRFASLDDEYFVVPKERLDEPGVQEAAYEKLKKPEFQVKALRDSIIELGYLSIDGIVVSEIEQDKYLVIEGNRRLAAMKWIEELINEGLVEPTTRESYKEIQIRVIKKEFDNEINRLKIQGVRHISEIRPWGTYQKALLIRSMIDEEKLSPQDVANGIGYRTQEVNRIYNAYKLFQQMKDDPDYGENAEPELISYFYELVGRRPLRDHFGYNDETKYFENEDEYKFFYKWIIEDPDNNFVRKLGNTRNVRELVKVIENEDALNKLKEENSTFEEALAYVIKYNTTDWRKEINQALESLKKIPTDELESLSEDDIKLLTELKNLITKRISVYDKIKGF